MISKESLQFMLDLKTNNNRDWFLANKKRYEQYKKEYHSLIESFITEMSKIDPTLQNLEVKNCSFRINRDIRFSKDKTPYKNHMGIWMSGSKGQNAAGYYIQLEPRASFIAGGLHAPDAIGLKKVRSEIAFFSDELRKILSDKKLKEVYGELDRTAANSLKTAPKDFDKNHEAIEFLKLKSFTVTHKIGDAELSNPDFVRNTATKLSAIKPLNDFINRAVNH